MLETKSSILIFSVSSTFTATNILPIPDTMCKNLGTVPSITTTVIPERIGHQGDHQCGLFQRQIWFAEDFVGKLANWSMCSCCWSFSSSRSSTSVILPSVMSAIFIRTHCTTLLLMVFPFPLPHYPFSPIFLAPNPPQVPNPTYMYQNSRRTHFRSFPRDLGRLHQFPARFNNYFMKDKY